MLKEKTMRDVLSPKNGIGTLSSNAEIIKNLNETKQYTLMATGLLESVITDPNLTAAAAKLWEYLYSKAIMNDKICIKMPYKDLAAKFSRSERTIKRHVEDLKENGYLHVESNFNYRGQRANTFYLQIPQTIIDNLKNTNDRKKNPPQDKDVTPGHDSNVTLNNNIKKDIILNNNNVVVSFQKTSENTACNLQSENNSTEIPQNCADNVLRGTQNDDLNTLDQEKIENLTTEINRLYVDMGSLPNENKIPVFDKIRKLQATVSTITVIMNRRNQLKNLPSPDFDKNNKTKGYVDPTIDFSKVIGERVLSLIEIARIKKITKKMLLQTNDQERVCNEIIYAIRFGALTLNQNGESLSIAHSTSIALKLLREKRWETPAPLQKTKQRSDYRIQMSKPLHNSLSQNNQRAGNYVKKINQISGLPRVQRVEIAAV